MTNTTAEQLATEYEQALRATLMGMSWSARGNVNELITAVLSVRDSELDTYRSALAATVAAQQELQLDVKRQRDQLANALDVYPDDAPSFDSLIDTLETSEADMMRTNGRLESQIREARTYLSTIRDVAIAEIGYRSAYEPGGELWPVGYVRALAESHAELRKQRDDLIDHMDYVGDRS